MASKYATYKIVGRLDPALILPAMPDLDDPPAADDGAPGTHSDEVLAEYEAACTRVFAAWEEQLTIARERQDWTGLVAEGKAPRYVVMRWVPDEVLAWWRDQRKEKGGQHGSDESLRLLVRLALHSIEGDKPRVFKLTHSDRVDWDVADREALDELKAIVGGDVYPVFVTNLGRQVFQQEARGRPL